MGAPEEVIHDFIVYLLVDFTLHLLVDFMIYSAPSAIEICSIADLFLLVVVTQSLMSLLLLRNSSDEKFEPKSSGFQPPKTTI